MPQVIRIWDGTIWQPKAVITLAASWNAAGDVTNPTWSIPAETQEGDLIVLFGGTRNAGTHTFNSGFTTHIPDASGSATSRTAMAYKVAGVSDAGTTVGISESYPGTNRSVRITLVFRSTRAGSWANTISPVLAGGVNTANSTGFGPRDYGLAVATMYSVNGTGFPAIGTNPGWNDAVTNSTSGWRGTVVWRQVGPHEDYSGAYTFSAGSDRVSTMTGFDVDYD